MDRQNETSWPDTLVYTPYLSDPRYQTEKQPTIDMLKNAKMMKSNNMIRYRKPQHTITKRINTEIAELLPATSNTQTGSALNDTKLDYASEDDETRVVCPMFPKCTSYNNRIRDLKKHIRKNHPGRTVERVFDQKSISEIETALITLAEQIASTGNVSASQKCQICGCVPIDERSLGQPRCATCVTYRSKHGVDRPADIARVNAARKKIKSHYTYDMRTFRMMALEIGDSDAE